MERHKPRVIPVLGIISLATLAACGTSTGSGGGGGSSSGPLDNCVGQVTVASDLPTSGGDAAIGGGTEKGVRLAVDQANAAKLLGGCTINYIAKDDSSVAKGKHDPQQGAQNVTALVANQAVVGIIGPFNSSVAVAELPITNKAGVAQISPSNTDPGLTIAGSDPDIDTASLKPTGKTTYFRVISNDVVQAEVMAEVAYKELKLRKVYDIDDQETYGKDLSNYFDKDFQKLGGTVVARASLPGDTKDFRPQITDAQGKGADSVFFGGVASNGSGILKKQMADAGFNAQFLSGDGTVDPQFFIDAGAQGDGAQASSAPDTTKLSSAQQFISQYKKRYSQDVVAYSTYGYDCMNILLQAIHDVLVANGGKIPSDPAAFRARVIAKIQGIDYKGTIGETKFDSLGDTENHDFSVYKATGGKWVARETISPSVNPSAG
jgi:branched-chain amino acid transport system substrate-binding protein